MASSSPVVLKLHYHISCHRTLGILQGRVLCVLFPSSFNAERERASRIEWFRRTCMKFTELLRQGKCTALHAALSSQQHYYCFFSLQECPFGLLSFLVSESPIEFYCHLLCILVPSDALHRLDEDLEPHWRGRWQTFGPGKLAARPHLESHQCNTCQRAREKEKALDFREGLSCCFKGVWDKIFTISFFRHKGRIHTEAKT